jgi:hypothetical protein
MDIEDTIFQTYPATNHNPACYRLKELITKLHDGEEVQEKIKRCVWLILWQLRNAGLEIFEIDEIYPDLYDMKDD